MLNTKNGFNYRYWNDQMPVAFKEVLKDQISAEQMFEYDVYCACIALCFNDERTHDGSILHKNMIPLMWVTYLQEYLPQFDPKKPMHRVMNHVILELAHNLVRCIRENKNIPQSINAYIDQEFSLFEDGSLSDVFDDDREIAIAEEANARLMEFVTKH